MNKKRVKNRLFEELDTILCMVEDDLGIKPIELTDKEQDECDALLESFAEFIMKLYNKHS